ncbi:Triosephosphate isomerase [Rhizobium aethiopicum]|uniref:Triosephosphate isomerase n=1 Tax=Rhizobium aethiopicum TaxID=1138170 RepID=A0A1C3Y2P4_9HYPH|nr:Triosephosphate isomerase [Rhizobium aethiopicum]
MVVWVGTSFKMNKTLEEALAFAPRLADADRGRDTRVQRFVIPSFTTVREVKRVLDETSVKVGAQNMHWEDAGAWTGEVSPAMLKDCRLDLVELGHSERREHFSETDETVGLKVSAAIRHGLTPLICIGETLQERQEGQADSVLRRQVEAALASTPRPARLRSCLPTSPSGQSASTVFRRQPITPPSGTAGLPRWRRPFSAARCLFSTAAASIPTIARN